MTVTYLLVLIYLQKLLGFFAEISFEQYMYSFLNLKLYSLNHFLYFPCYSCTYCMILIAEIQQLNFDASMACMTAPGFEKLFIFGTSKSKNDGNSNC